MKRALVFAIFVALSEGQGSMVSTIAIRPYLISHLILEYNVKL
jgi:hypothetical protein